MDTCQSSRWLFRSAALFNGAAVLVLAPWFGLPHWLGLQAAGNGLYDHVALLTIGGFGAAYWLAGDDPRRHRSVVVLGAWLKLAVVALVVGHWSAGATPTRLVALVSGDLVYAVLFFHHLRRTAPRGS